MAIINTGFGFNAQFSVFLKSPLNLMNRLLK